MKVVLVRFRDGERRDLLLPEAMTVVGRRPDCDLRIPARDVSRRHCELAVGENELRVKDLGSSNGTFVNGQRVAEKVLAPGDRLRVGPVVFVVQIDGKPKEIEPVIAPPILEEPDEVGDTIAPLEQPEPSEPAKPAKAPKPGKPVEAAAVPALPDTDDGDQVFELTADDFDLEDAISALDELEDEDDLP